MNSESHERIVEKEFYLRFDIHVKYEVVIWLNLFCKMYFWNMFPASVAIHSSSGCHDFSRNLLS